MTEVSDNACTCHVTPTNRVGQMIDRHNRLVYAFNMDCPEHGIGEPKFRPMRITWERAWMPLMQAIMMNNQVDGMHCIKKASNGQSALMEWIKYEMYPENEEHKVVGLLNTLTPAQRQAIMLYDGPENMGPDSFKLSQNKDSTNDEKTVDNVIHL